MRAWLPRNGFMEDSHNKRERRTYGSRRYPDDKILFVYYRPHRGMRPAWDIDNVVVFDIDNVGPELAPRLKQAETFEIKKVGGWDLPVTKPGEFFFMEERDGYEEEIGGRFAYRVKEFLLANGLPGLTEHVERSTSPTAEERAAGLVRIEDRVFFEGSPHPHNEAQYLARSISGAHVNARRTGDGRMALTVILSTKGRSVSDLDVFLPLLEQIIEGKAALPQITDQIRDGRPKHG